MEDSYNKIVCALRDPSVNVIQTSKKFVWETITNYAVSQSINTTKSSIAVFTFLSDDAVYLTELFCEKICRLYGSECIINHSKTGVWWKIMDDIRKYRVYHLNYNNLRGIDADVIYIHIRSVDGNAISALYSRPYDSIMYTVVVPLLELKMAKHISVIQELRASS